jgi:hypothetical protein
LNLPKNNSPTPTADDLRHDNRTAVPTHETTTER